MRFSSRQRRILNLLLQHGKGLTIGAIAGQIGVSARTVHRELDVLQDAAGAYGLELVRKAGVGVELDGPSERKEALQLALLERSTIEYTPEERHVFILCTLLEAAEPVKLLSLALDLNVTTATISHDLDQVERVLEGSGLALVRKRGYGVAITGPESAKRRLISGLILEHLDEHQLIGLVRESIQNQSRRELDSIAERLFGLIEKEKLIQAEAALKDLEKALPYPLADSAWIGLVIHLALALKRLEQGEKIRFDEQTLHELAGTQEYQAAERIIGRLRELVSIEIPDAEIGYISMHLRGAKQRSTQEYPGMPPNAELLEKTGCLIARCEERLGVPLRNDRSLFHGLLTHLEPALYRLKSQLEIRNPLLAQIRNTYPELFDIVREVTAEVLPGLPVPDEEIGYLVMHIGAAVERLAPAEGRYRALVVCSSGIGSSRILATRIQREIPAIASLKNLSLFEVADIPRHEYDLVISTIPLPVDAGEYVLVSPLLPQEDIRKINQALQRIRRSAASPAAQAGTSRVRPGDWLRSLHHCVDCAVQLLDGFQLRRLQAPAGNLRQILDTICSDLQQQGVVSDAAAVVHQLLERERRGGLGIPGTSLALFHAASEQVRRPSFTVHALPEPIRLKSMDGQEVSVQCLLLMLGPKDGDRASREVLSEISALLIEPGMIAALESGDEQRIADLLAERLYQFCQNQTELERE